MGIAGAIGQAQALARWVVAQIATWHTPGDVSLVILGSPTDPERWAWARWLPHVRFNRAEFVSATALTDEAVLTLAAAVASEVDRRHHIAETARGVDAEMSAMVVILDGVYRLGSLASVTRILRDGPAVGVYAVCIEESEYFLPEECATAALFDSSQPTRLTIKGTGAVSAHGVLADLVSIAWAEALARQLAPLRLSRGQEVSAGVPIALRLLDDLGMEHPNPARIRAGWARGGRSTKAPIGRTAAGLLIFDLARHGPHGLVAGTTGSGKSELLQTMIASLAVANRPDAMTFVLVDYKGGSAFKDCAELPHTVGMVTDLDAYLTERALTSLGAELRRREHVLLAAGAKDIEDLVRQAERLGADPPLARLVIVIDEFASLVEELPGFVDGLVDIARRGRSLGIHLILATQRPAGVVSGPIKANTNFRVAMRVTDVADSTDVIDSPSAARISKDIPGRGYLRVGHEQLTEFQAARVGGFRQRTGQHTGVEVYPVPLDRLVAPPPRKVMLGDEEESTDLSVLVQAIGKAASEAGFEPPMRPWLEPLGDINVLEGVWVEPLRLVFGVEDFPEEQRQDAASWDLVSGGHLIVAGDSGSGRSTTLRTIAAAVARQTSPADVHLYGIDCGNGMLGPLVELVHTAAVASRIETDRVDRILARLESEITRRQQLLAAGGFSSIDDQRRAVPAEQALPYLILFIDRWEGFTSVFESIDNGRLIALVLNLMREGMGAGLRVVLAGDRSVLASRVCSLAEQTIVLHMNDRATYSSAGLNPRQVPDAMPPGRALRAYGRTELQVAVLDRDLSGPAQVAALSGLARRSQERWLGVNKALLPEPIRVLPNHLDFTEIERPARTEASRRTVIGVGGDRLVSITVDLGNETTSLIVAGPAKSGRSNLAFVIARQALDQGVCVVVLTARPSPLHQLAGAEGVLGVFDANADPAPDIDAVLRTEQPMVVVVDDAEMVGSAPVGDILVGYLSRARDNTNALVVAGTTAEMAAGFRGFVPEAKKSQTGVILCAGSVADGDILGLRLPRTALSNGPVGRGIFVRATQMISLQTPRLVHAI
jgi:S-DNA-T family DNA segregation ATPase FtsK/SpoIIIE